MQSNYFAHAMGHIINYSNSWMYVYIVYLLKSPWSFAFFHNLNVFVQAYTVLVDMLSLNMTFLTRITGKYGVHYVLK